jgi:hypothetical protein
MLGISSCDGSQARFDGGRRPGGVAVLALDYGHPVDRVLLHVGVDAAAHLALYVLDYVKFLSYLYTSS